jgi:uncharacterized membrane protein
MTDPASSSTCCSKLRMLLTVGGILLIAAVVAMPLIAGPPAEGTKVDDLVRFFGRLHPVILHLPIGILVVAGLFEFGGIFARKQRVCAGPGLLFLGAVSAVLAAILGFLLWQGSAGDYNEELVERHLWGGIAVAALAIIALLVRLWTVGRSPWPCRLTIFASVGVLTFASHDGGTLTHGEGYLTQYAPQALRELLGEAPSQASAADAPVARPAAEQVVYADVIVPILEQKCYACHNAEKKKGKFRMDEYELLVEGGEEGKGIEPGNAAESAIVVRIELPLEEDEHMPPDGKKQIEDHELVLIKWWLDQGGSPTAKLADLPKTPEVESALAKRVTPEQLAAAKAQQDLADKKRTTERSAIAGSLASLQQEFPGAISFEAQNSSAVVFSAVSMRQAFANDQLGKLSPVVPALVSLDLSGTRVDDSGLRQLEPAKQLRMLRLSETPVTDAGLAIIAKMNTLESLNLYGTQITDAGLATLGGLANLKYLYLWQTKVTDEAVAALQKKLPGCEIIRGL